MRKRPSFQRRGTARAFRVAAAATYPCGQRRPSEHSIMRWIGFDWDQVGREHVVARITGMRNAGQMSLRHTPSGTVPADGVLWVETGHPRHHELRVTWRANGTVLTTNGSRSLALSALGLPAGTVVSVEVRDPVGPDGIDWVRNPSAGDSATDSGFNGPRFVQTRQWTVGPPGVVASPPAAQITGSTLTGQPVAGDEVVFVETNHPTDRVLDAAPTAPRRLSTPLTTRCPRRRCGSATPARASRR